jgi:hypothetical protein
MQPQVLQILQQQLQQQQHQPRCSGAAAAVSSRCCCSSVWLRPHGHKQQGGFLCGVWLVWQYHTLSAVACLLPCGSGLCLLQTSGRPLQPMSLSEWC